jgi:type II secretory pathway component PulM
VKSWFESLEQREQLALSVGIVLAGLIILWSFVWTPLRSGATELDATVVEKQILLASLYQAQALDGSASPGSQTGGTTTSLVLLVDQTTRTHGLASRLQRNQPDGPDGIRVTFQAAEFDSLMDWLVLLQRGHGVAVESANFNSELQTGFVSATLVLRRS